MKKPSKKTKPTTVKLSQNGSVKVLPEIEIASRLNALAQSNANAALGECRKILAENKNAELVRKIYYDLLGKMELKQGLLEDTDIQLRLFPRNKLALSYKAHALRLLGRIEEATAVLEKLLKVTPRDPGTLNSLASAVKELGDFDRANELLTRALAIKPDYGKAHWNKSDISMTPEEDLNQINALLQGNRIPESERHYLHFSAYRKLEKLGEVDKAFEQLELANKKKRDTFNYSVATDLSIDRGIENLFDQDFIASKQQSESADFNPIFIFGMPRSGTTLVEQIIASHSTVKGGNELSALGDATRRVQREHHLSGDFPEWLKALPDASWPKIRQYYRELTKDIQGTSQFLTDKALLNYKTVGLIKIAIPGAKLIQVDRNPMDLCFGCYRQLFNEGLRFSYDFEELAKTYASYQKLMDHWDQVLPGFVLRVRYEDLASAPQNQIESILNFCGLDHEPGCFEPHKTRRTVRTLSATQVREPIFTSGIDRWKKYEAQLAPLVEALKIEGIHLD